MRARTAAADLTATLKRLVVWSVLTIALTYPIAGFVVEYRDGVQLVEHRLAPLWIGLFVFGSGAVVFGLRRTSRALAVGRRTAGVRDALVAHKLTLWVMAAVGLALVIAIPYAKAKYVNLAVETLLYIELALGLNVVVGTAGLLVLGYAGFYALGAYTYAILALQYGWSFWPCLPLGALVATVAGLIVGLPVLRLRGDYLAIVTLGFNEVVRYLLKNMPSFTGGDQGLPNVKIKGDLQDPTEIFGFAFTTPEHYYWMMLVIVALTLVALRRLEHSRPGRALVAMREDEIAARHMGIDTTRLKLVAFMLSASIAGLAGVIFAARNNFVNPDTFKFDLSVMILAMVVLGGMGSLLGVMAGATILWTLLFLLRDIKALAGIQEYRMLIFGAVMVIVMIVRPQGLFGSARRKLELVGNAGGDEEPD